MILTELRMTSPDGDDSKERPTSAHAKKPTGGVVLRRIISIIGVYPSRTDLIYLWNTLHWGPLGRTEKRVKAALLRKLESLHDQILPALETPDGLHKLQDAYVSILRRQRDRIGIPSVPAFNGPPQTSAEFLLDDAVPHPRE
jgi:hypothetical protein